jgi:hypothetical protein
VYDPFAPYRVNDVCELDTPVCIERYNHKHYCKRPFEGSLSITSFSCPSFLTSNGVYHPPPPVGQPVTVSTVLVVKGTLVVPVIRVVLVEVLVATLVVVTRAVDRIVEVMVVSLLLTLVLVETVLEVTVLGIREVAVVVFVLVPVE